MHVPIIVSSQIKNQVGEKKKKAISELMETRSELKTKQKIFQFEVLACCVT